MSRFQHIGCESFDYELAGVPLECFLEYSAPERGSRERGTGLQMEPDYAESATLCYAYASNADIFEILSAQQCEEIETSFLEQERE